MFWIMCSILIPWSWELIVSLVSLFFCENYFKSSFNLIYKVKDDDKLNNGPNTNESNDGSIESSNDKESKYFF